MPKNNSVSSNKAYGNKTSAGLWSQGWLLKAQFFSKNSHLRANISFPLYPASPQPSLSHLSQQMPPAMHDVNQLRSRFAYSLPLFIVRKYWREIEKGETKRPYGPSSFVIVPVHGWSSVWSVLSGVRKLPRHHAPKLHVLAAAPPFPAFPRRALVAGVTAADGGRALGARSGHRESHSSRGNGVDKGWFPGSCGREKSMNSGQWRHHAWLRSEYLLSSAWQKKLSSSLWSGLDLLQRRLLILRNKLLV